VRSSNKFFRYFISKLSQYSWCFLIIFSLSFVLIFSKFHPKAGIVPMKFASALSLAKTSAISFPMIPVWPGTQASLI
jgi:hypothetical protein